MLCIFRSGLPEPVMIWLDVAVSANMSVVWAPSIVCWERYCFDYVENVSELGRIEPERVADHLGTSVMLLVYSG